MTDEKILAFLNIEKEIDKSLMKIVFWFDFFSTIFIVIGGFTLEVLTKTYIEILVVLSFIGSIFIFAIWLAFAKNPVQVYYYTTVVTMVTSIKLIYGSNKFSILENENFTIWHITVLLFFILLAMVGILKKHQFLNDLKVMTIKQAQKKMDKKNKGKSAIFLPVSLTGCVAFLLSRVFSKTFDLGLGFILWALASIWIFLSLGSIYNFVISKKYNVANIFRKTEHKG